MSVITTKSFSILYLSLAILLVGPKAARSSPSNSLFVSHLSLSPPSLLSKHNNNRRNARHHYPLNNNNAQTTISTESPPSQQQQQQHPSGRRWKNRRKRQTFVPSPVRNVPPAEERALMDQLGYVPSNVCSVSARSGDYCARLDDDDILIAENNNDDNDDDDSTVMIDGSSNGIGRPIAIRSYPLLVQQQQQQKQQSANDGESHIIHLDSCNVTPFPTLYWLTCPHVSRAISELERIGHVRNFQTKLENNPQLAKEWWECHEEYAAERWNILTDDHREWLLQGNNEDAQGEGENNSGNMEKKWRGRESMREMIRCSGVAGTDHRGVRAITDPSLVGGGDDDAAVATADDNNFVPSVKCLHSHYAHYRSQLARSTYYAGAAVVADDDDDGAEMKFNLAGLWTHELLLEHFPDLVV